MAITPFPAGYRPEIHDEMDALDAAADIADSSGLSDYEEYPVLAVHSIAQSIKRARAARWRI